MSVQPEVMETDEAIQEVENDFEEEEDNEAEEEETRDDAEEQVEEEEEGEEEDGPGDDQQAEEQAPIKKKRGGKEQAMPKREREAGKSLLPFSRVQKIIKADKEMPIVAKDAVFLVSLATEAFIAELAQAAQRVAEKERRTTVQHKDIAIVVRKADEFMFLEDIIAWTGPDAEKKRGKAVAGGGGAKESGRTLLDQFVVGKESGMDVVMNEDGTMDGVDSEIIHD